MSGCDNCYFKGRTLNNDGDETSPFVIVGESAGAIEIHKGLPFQGPAGRLLKETLEKVGLDDLPFQPFYTNAIQCMPRKKTPESLAAACVRCRSRLLETIRKHPRKVILALGNGAMWSTTGNFDLKITKERGKLFKSELAEEGIVTSVHPAALLYGSGNYLQFKQDLEYAISLVREGSSARKLPNGVTWRILETEEEVAQLAQEMREMPKGTPVANDIETTGFSEFRDRILELGIQHKPKLATIIPAHLITDDLYQNECKHIWHNGKFDIKFLLHDKYGCNSVRVDEDTMLMSYSLNERKGIHDLDQVASDWLGSPNHKSMVDPYIKGTIVDAETGEKRKRNYGDIPVDIRHKYLALDLSDTYQLYFTLREKVREDKHTEKLYTKTLIPAVPYLSKLERNGFLIDQDRVKENMKRLQGEIKEHEDFINEIAEDKFGIHVNVRSPKQLKELLYLRLKLGNMGMSTDVDTLEKLPKHPIVEALKKHRKVQKAYSTYVKAVWNNIEYDGRVHTTYLLHGTATGRLSSRDPNLQNIPRDPLLRGQYMARPGYGIIECDFSQAELRSLAELSGCTALSEIFIKGEKSLHDELSEFLFGENFTKEDKMKAKTVNFGIVYGREAPSIAEAFDVPTAEAQRWIDGWFERFPGAAAYIQQCRMAPIKNQTIITCFGNKKRPGVVTRERIKDLQNESANFPHQNIASNLTMHSGILLVDDLRENFDTHLCNTVHDCLVGEVPLDAEHIRMTAAHMQGVMETVAPQWGLTKIPFVAEGEFGHRWGNLISVNDIKKKYNDVLEDIPTYIAAH